MAFIRQGSNTLDPKGTSAEAIAGLWWLLLAMGAVAFVIFVVGLIIGIRRTPVTSSLGEFADGPPVSEGTTQASTRRWLVWGGVVLPSVAVVAVIGATIGTMRTLEGDRDDVELVVDVTGHQWWWEVDYGDLDFVTANEIHIPADQTVLLRLHSDDVIHSVWIPELAGKMDLIPGRTNELLIDALAPGRYAGSCAEFCGLQHARMRLTVVAHEPADFERWAEGQRADAPAPQTPEQQAGLAALESSECASCHRIAGTSADGTDGPDLTHLMSRDTLAAGTIANDREHLGAWVTEPDQFKEGVLMPPPDLTPSEIEAVVAYLETLS